MSNKEINLENKQNIDKTEIKKLNKLQDIENNENENLKKRIESK